MPERELSVSFEQKVRERFHGVDATDELALELARKLDRVGAIIESGERITKIAIARALKGNK